MLRKQIQPNVINKIMQVIIYLVLLIPIPLTTYSQKAIKPITTSASGWGFDAPIHRLSFKYGTLNYLSIDGIEDISMQSVDVEFNGYTIFSRIKNTDIAHMLSFSVSLAYSWGEKTVETDNYYFPKLNLTASRFTYELGFISGHGGVTNKFDVMPYFILKYPLWDYVTLPTSKEFNDNNYTNNFFPTQNLINGIDFTFGNTIGIFGEYGLETHFNKNDNCGDIIPGQLTDFGYFVGTELLTRWLGNYAPTLSCVLYPLMINSYSIISFIGKKSRAGFPYDKGLEPLSIYTSRVGIRIYFNEDGSTF